MTNRQKNLKSQKGASAIEYALLIACLVLVLVTALSSFGGDISKSMTNLFGKVKSSLEQTD